MTDPDQDLERELTSLLERGDKIAAIRLLRERRKLGLAEAKAAVERFEAGSGLPEAPAAGVGEELPVDVRDLVAQGQKIQAIRLLREKQGLGLEEAKRRIELASGGPTRSGCVGALLVLILVGAGLRALA